MSALTLLRSIGYYVEHLSAATANLHHIFQSQRFLREASQMTDFCFYSTVVMKYHFNAWDVVIWYVVLCIFMFTGDSQLTFTCSTSTTETPEKRCEISSKLTIKAPNDITDIFRVFLLLTLKIFHTLFYCFYYRLTIYGYFQQRIMLNSLLYIKLSFSFKISL